LRYFGVISEDIQTSRNFIQHVVFELAYYHSPEDLQFVFFFEPEDDPTKQNEILQNYKYLPHANELLMGFPSLCLTRKVPVLFSVSFLHNE